VPCTQPSLTGCTCLPKCGSMMTMWYISSYNTASKPHTYSCGMMSHASPIPTTSQPYCAHAANRTTWASPTASHALACYERAGHIHGTVASDLAIPPQHVACIERAGITWLWLGRGLLGVVVGSGVDGNGQAVGKGKGTYQCKTIHQVNIMLECLVPGKAPANCNHVQLP
jgi:hypothetical protein